MRLREEARAIFWFLVGGIIVVQQLRQRNKTDRERGRETMLSSVELASVNAVSRRRKIKLACHSTNVIKTARWRYWTVITPNHRRRPRFFISSLLLFRRRLLRVLWPSRTVETEYESSPLLRLMSSPKLRPVHSVHRFALSSPVSNSINRIKPHLFTGLSLTWRQAWPNKLLVTNFIDDTLLFVFFPLL